MPLKGLLNVFNYQVLLTLIALLLSNPSFSAPLTLNGIANYSELRQDYYIAALYLPKKNPNSQMILQSAMAKKIKLLVTIDSWSPRDWSRQWQNNIAINNPLPDDDFIKQVNVFSQLLKRELLKGDLIEITFKSGLGSQVFINEQLMQSTQNDHLFNAILNTWIGKLPPSRDFKKRILTLVNDQTTQADLQALYINQISEQRKLDIVKWHYTDDEINQVARQKQQQKQQKEEEIATLKKRLADRKKAIIELQKEKEKNKKNLALQKKNRLEKNTASAIKKKTELNKQETLAKKKQYKKRIREQSYYKDLYHWKLYTEIRKNIKYPVWAREFNQEGLVKARFTINKRGQVIDTQFTQEESSSFLIAEVRESINNISGKILPPKNLAGKQWQFTLSHNFSFSSKKQNHVKQPRKPSHL